MRLRDRRAAVSMFLRAGESMDNGNFNLGRLLQIATSVNRRQWRWYPQVMDIGVS